MANYKIDRLMVASDYAVLPFDGGSFYYGYESTIPGHDREEDEYEAEWCFELRSDATQGVVAKIPYSQLASRTDRSPSMFEVTANLLAGISVCIDRGILGVAGRGQCEADVIRSAAAMRDDFDDEDLIYQPDSVQEVCRKVDALRVAKEASDA